MTSNVTVSYGRKRTDKLGDGSFDAVELGTILTLNDLPEDVDALTTQVELFKALRSKVDEEFDSIERTTALPPIRSIPQQLEQQVQEDERMDAPPKKPLSWLKDKVDAETANIQDRMSAMPGEKISGGGSAIDAEGTPAASTVRFNEAVFFPNCRVFNVEVKTASNGNPYCAIRIGKRGPDGIPGQYVTARSFDPAIVKEAQRTREGDMVDVYGFFKPWRNDDSKFDLELQKIERSEG